MKLFFRYDNCSESLSNGIELLAGDLNFQLAYEAEADTTITVCSINETKIVAELNGNTAKITYGGGKARFFRALAILVKWLRSGITSKTITETPLFDTNGAMVDMSRNAVMNVTTV